MWRISSAWIIAAAATLTAGCAAGERQAPVSSLLELRRQGVVMQQWDLSCGAAAVATILAFQHGDPVPEKQIAQAMLRRTDPLRVQVRGGFSFLDLKRYVDSRGYEGTGYGELTLETLTQLGPAIVPILTNGYSHFVVFRDVVGDRVVLADPAFGNRTMTLRDFEEAWLQQLGFVVESRTRPVGAGRLAPRRENLAVPSAVALRQAFR